MVGGLQFGLLYTCIRHDWYYVLYVEYIKCSDRRIHVMYTCSECHTFNYCLCYLSMNVIHIA